MGITVVMEVHASRSAFASTGRQMSVPGASLLLFALTLFPQPQSAAQILYSIGDPSNEAQLYLEKINRARATPAAEGARLAAELDVYTKSEYDWWPVNLGMMQSEFSALAAQPPLAMNAALTSAAEGHSADMHLTGFQGHTGSDGSGIGDRIIAAGYGGWSGASENVYSYSQNVDHGHASLQVDWGPGAGWMQTGRPHRENIHSGDFAEVGIGVVSGSNGSFGPGFVTQDFSRRSGFDIFITGVVYYDLDADGFYDMGEGIGGVEVDVAGASYYAITSASGGYAVPVTGNGTYSVTFSMEGYAPTTLSATVSGSASKKLDWTPPYTAADAIGPSLVGVGSTQTFQIASVSGADAYDAKAASLLASPAAEGAENGSSGLTIDTTGGYTVLQSSIRYSGSWAFHLAHSSSSSPDQTVTLEREFIPSASASLQFRSRLRASDSAQWALVEVSANGGESWDQIWRKQGSGGSGESTFSLKTVSLADYAGEHIKLRFNYASASGYYYAGTSSAYGWYFDAVSFNGMTEIVSSTTIGGISKDVRSFDYTASSAGSEALFARALTQGAALSWSEGLTVTASDNSYSAWAARKENEAGLSSGALTNPAGDLDGDGLTHAMEYALEAQGLDPTSGITDGLPVAVIEGNYFNYDYIVDTSKPDVTLQVHASSNLAGWYLPGETGKPPGFQDFVLTSGPGSLATRRARVPLANGVAYFRLVATVTGVSP